MYLLFILTYGGHWAAEYHIIQNYHLTEEFLKGKVVPVLNQVPHHEDILWKYSSTYS
jgi:hypothetical protein